MGGGTSVGLSSLNWKDWIMLMTLPCYLTLSVTYMRRLWSYGQQIWLKVNNKKTKMMTVKCTEMLRREAIETTKAFSYIGSTVTEYGGAEEDIRSRLGKARTAFARLKPVWKSSQYSRHTKVKIYNSCILFSAVI